MCKEVIKLIQLGTPTKKNEPRGEICEYAMSAGKRERRDHAGSRHRQHSFPPQLCALPVSGT